MGSFFDDTMQGLLQAVEIENGNITQKQLAEITGNKQQAISRIEKQENSPSLQTFCNILSALGYGLVIEKK